MKTNIINRIRWSEPHTSTHLKIWFENFNNKKILAILYIYLCHRLSVFFEWWKDAYTMKKVNITVNEAFYFIHVRLYTIWILSHTSISKLSFFDNNYVSRMLPLCCYYLYALMILKINHFTFRWQQCPSSLMFKGHQPLQVPS